MWFMMQEMLGESRVRTELKYVFKDGITSQVIGILAGGEFLSGFRMTNIKNLTERIFPHGEKTG
jgi:hypothetical protein